MRDALNKRVAAVQAAQQIIEKLSGRKGFDSWWDDIELSLQEEITDEISRVVEEAIVKVRGH